MKKLFYYFLAVLFSSSTLISCNGTSSAIKDDAKKLAELNCKMQDMTQKSGSGNLSDFSESMKLTSEIIQLTLQMNEKYSSAQDNEKFNKALAEAMKDCN